MFEPNYASIRLGFRFALIDYFRLHSQCIADKNWVGKLHLIHPKIADRCAQRRIANRQTNHQSKSEIAIH